jgi:hypothetical protein
MVFEYMKKTNQQPRPKGLGIKPLSTNKQSVGLVCFQTEK